MQNEFLYFVVNVFILDIHRALWYCNFDP